MWLLIIIVLLLVLHLYRYYKPLGQLPPGPFPLPLMGNIHQIEFERIQDVLEQWKKLYGGIFRVSMPQHMVMLTDYDSIREALVKNADAFSGRPHSAIFDIISEGNFGLSFATGPVQREHRRFALHTLRNFGFGKNVMEQKILTSAQSLIDDLEEQVDVPGGFNVSLSVHYAIANMVLDLLCGHNYEGHRQQLFKLTGLLDESFKIVSSSKIRAIEICKYLQYVPVWDNFNAAPLKEIMRQLNDYVKDEIKQREREYDCSHEPTNYIEAFLQHRSQPGVDHTVYSDWQLHRSILDLWVAGLETTVTTLKWAFVFMMKHEDIREKVISEIHDAIGRDVQPSMAHQTSTPYTCAVIAEVQRCANIVTLNLFHEALEDTVVCGYHIPKGTVVLPNISNHLWDEKAFPEPKVFRPERFLDTVDGQLKVVNTEQLIPFGLGRRGCLGESMARMQLYLIFVSVMQKFRLANVAGQQIPTFDQAILAATRMTPPYNIHVSRA